MKTLPLTLAIAITVITAVSSLSTSPVQAKTFLDAIFGRSGTDDSETPPPEVTLQAPFPTKGKSTDGNNNNPLAKIYDEPRVDKTSVEMDQPHRSPDQIAEWASGIVSQAMTIVPDQWDTDFKTLSVNFTPYAAQEYKAYIQNVKLIDTLTSNHMRLQAISDGAGIVMKEGAITGTYHWLVQVPLMTSFYKTTMKEVDKTATAQSQNLIVQVQVGRIAAKDSNDIGLIIERWRVSSAAK